MFNLGFTEMIVIAIIALIFIGPKQLPEIARAIGRTLNELRRATGDLSASITNPKNYIEKDHIVNDNTDEKDLANSQKKESSETIVSEQNNSTTKSDQNNG